MEDPLLPLWVMELLGSVFLHAWIFALGATVGSFLNVVVYRLPRGINLAIPGSFCPHCRHPIRLSDNIPLVSWLALGGRCRDCGGRISPRYFAVELVVATTFLVVLAAEYFLPALALGLPTRQPLSPYDGAPFWGMYAMHMILATTLIGATLMAADGFEAPRIFAPAMLVGVVLPLIWPQVRSVPALGSRNADDWRAAVIDGAAGLAVGATIGLAAVFVERRIGKACPPLPSVAFASSIGIVMGWQRTLWMAPLALAACYLVAALLRTVATTSALPAAAPASDDASALETSAGVAHTITPQAIEDEVHIVTPPSEPSEPS
jgi:leader peptidase (prepilin peptidase)/N-methyltransferase